MANDDHMSDLWHRLAARMGLRALTDSPRRERWTRFQIRARNRPREALERAIAAERAGAIPPLPRRTGGHP